MTSTFGERLSRSIGKYGPLCVGIDPSPRLLADWGLPLRDFSFTVLEAARGVAGIVKPQIAFFERYGGRGLLVLEELCTAAIEQGFVVILDAKRGDIGSTNEAYASAYLSTDSPFAIDAITLSPYLGVTSMLPLLDAADQSGRGVFVLARTSNPGGEDVQCATSATGQTVAQDLLDAMSRRNAEAARRGVLGSAGVVFGATVPTDGHDLRAMNGPILAPGLGAQGATPADLAKRFAGCGDRVVVTVSRAVLEAGPDPASLAKRIRLLSDECREALEHVA
ncbi:orotidine-5'-phosphate decarboxylase [Nonomuraea turkmeniaca]|uniref:Orotidine 5'-phosphate decarboxylase n=1 Tax=Nonomuraea turkmeniaca TaxID=103838 RepID=A0A5S4FJG0_9ACTN|nr:orotidine-5'-phosphate decarboxylase [Nonomuraea turkmeniaca]TMR20729.1 orotidine-5'-phosphate decarboxylase [Nonomuraea turkmeniaca]